jgi:hypothetical protein
MKKQLLKSALIAVAGVGLLAGSGWADIAPYWTIEDLTAGDDGTANMSITFNEANNQNITFGIFNSTGGVLGTSAAVFLEGEHPSDGLTAVANFDWDGSNYDLTIRVRDAFFNIIRSDFYDDFGSIFGFYFIRDASPNDRLIYSDPLFSSNVGDNTANPILPP